MIVAARVHQSQEPMRIIQKSESLSRLAFGSCNRAHMPQPLWGRISSERPQVWLWAGDAVYVDLSDNGTWFTASEIEMENMYVKQKNLPEYAGFLAENPEMDVLGIYDDHDYGFNDVGKNFGSKEITKRSLLDFLDEDPESVRRHREGIYGVYSFGKDVNIFLIDGRWFRDDIDSVRYTGQYLGEEQWKWLDFHLKNTAPKARLNVIVSGVQVLANDRDLFLYPASAGVYHAEAWGLFAEERSKLFELLSRHRVPGVVFLSGDIHFAELNKLACTNVGYDLWELTSSGLTHSWQTYETPIHRLLPKFISRTIQYLTFKTMYWIAPHRFSVKTSGLLNYGVLDIDWEHDRLTMRIEGLEGNLFSHNLTISTLRFDENYLSRCTQQQKKIASSSIRDLSRYSWRFRAYLVMSIVSGIVGMILWYTFRIVRYVWRISKKLNSRPKAKQL